MMRGDGGDNSDAFLTVTPSPLKSVHLFPLPFCCFAPGKYFRVVVPLLSCCPAPHPPPLFVFELLYAEKIAEYLLLIGQRAGLPYKCIPQL